MVAYAVLVSIIAILGNLGARAEVDNTSVVREQYNVVGFPKDFIYIAKSRLRLSSECLKKNDLSCAAYAATQKASLKAVKDKLAAQAEPGSMICRQLGGQVLLARNEKKDELTFCRFTDGSLVSGGTLQYYGMKNDEKP